MLAGVILVTGATGMFGSRVARESAARGAKVRGLVHSSEKAGELAEGEIEAVVGDLDRPETLTGALDGVERVFLVTPMDDRIAERESAVIAAAKQAGVAEVVKLHGAVRHRGDPLDQEHQAAIAALKSSGLSWTIFSPQTVMETNLLSQAEAIMQTGAIWGSAGDGRVGMVAADDCGRAGGVVMTTDGHEGREYAITGPAALTFSEAAEILTRALGRPVAYNDLSEEDFKAVLVQQAGMTAEQAEIGVLMHYRAFKRGDGDLITDDYQRLTGQPPTTLEAWASAHVQAFS
jgi:uncharacterized protein YbjT (DUF2867 family)